MLELSKAIEQILIHNRLEPVKTDVAPAWWPTSPSSALTSNTSDSPSSPKTLWMAEWPAMMDERSDCLSHAHAVVMPGRLPLHILFSRDDQWCPVDLESDPPATLLLRRGGHWPAFVLETHYQHGVWLRRTIRPDDPSSPLLVTLMDYPDEEKYNLLCMVWMRRAQRFAPPQSRFLIFTTRGLSPPVWDYVRRYSNMEVRVIGRRPLSGFDHYNLSVKLPILAAIKEPFLFLDADMAVLSPLEDLWRRRHYKPWIGVDDQASQIGFSAPFAHLNSGMQLVSEPAFYDYDGLVECFEEHGRRFLVNGEDQSLLFDYFRTIGYDYQHPHIDEGWNCCSKYARLWRRPDGEWQAESIGLPKRYSVHIIHYFNGACRPWHIRCPLYTEERARFQHEGVALSQKKKIKPNHVKTPGSDAVLRLCLLNAAPDYIQSPGCHPFYPLTRWHTELVSNPDEADIIFWALNPADPKPDYHMLAFQHNNLFKKHERRFMLFSSVPRPGIFYLNDAFTYTPFPVYDRATNRLSNVISIPWLYDGVSPAIALDPHRIQSSRHVEKTCDLIFHRLIEPLAQSGLRRADAIRYQMLELERAAPPDFVSRELKRLATARYYLHCHSDTHAPLLLYHALALGVVPIILNMPDLPFSEVADWQSFALFPQAGRMLDDLLAAGEPHFAVMRQKAIAFADEYVLPPRANAQLLDLFFSDQWPESNRLPHTEN